jgi:hypothetical protein
MPRARSHWALLIQTREALRDAVPEAYGHAVRYRDEFFAGGIAPDAIRLFAGRDKLSSHFYDDQRQETWSHVVATMSHAQPSIADWARLAPPARAWMLGYLTHILTDIAYWRNVISRLPAFPAESGVHHGAWVLADQLAIPQAERHLDVDVLRFDDAPPWVDEAAVRRMIARVVERILAADGMWPVELSYIRYRPELEGKSDAEVFEIILPEWEANVARARDVVPEAAWRAFHRDAVAGAVATIAGYLEAVAPDLTYPGPARSEGSPEAGPAEPATPSAQAAEKPASGVASP